MIGVDAGNLHRDHRGMGRYLRSILEVWSERESGEFLFICPRSGLDACREELRAFWPEFRLVTPGDRALENLKVCWFPWNTVSFEVSCPRVVNIYDLAPFVFPEGNAALRKKMLEAARRAELIITISEFSRSEIVRFLGVPESVVRVVYPGVGERKFREGAVRDEKKDFGPYILFVGTMEARKNAPGLIEAFALLKRRYSFPHRLVLAGEVPPDVRIYLGFIHVARKNSSIAGLAAKLGVSGSLVLAGPVGDEDLRGLYRGASLFVFPSLYEGFGLPLLEAMACGIPIAASTGTSIREVAGEAALYFNPERPEDMAEKMARILGDEALGLALAEEGRKRLPGFTWEKCAKEILDLLKNQKS